MGKQDTSRRGEPWSYSEDLQLMREVKNGGSIKSIALIHLRTTGGIDARIGKLIQDGRLPVPESAGRFFLVVKDLGESRLSKDEAIARAKQAARISPGSTWIVMEAIGTCCAPVPEPIWKEL